MLPEENFLVFRGYWRKIIKSSVRVICWGEIRISSAFAKAMADKYIADGPSWQEIVLVFIQTE